MAAAILAAWAASLGWLVKRELFRTTGARLAEAALSVPPGAAYYRLDLGGQQIGFASSIVDTFTHSIRLEDNLVLDAPALGRLHRTTARSRAVLTRTLRLQIVGSRFDSDAERFRSHGVVEGDTVLKMAVTSDGESETTFLRLTRPIVLPALLPLHLAFGGELKPGRSYAMRVLDPLFLTVRDVTVTIAAESTLVVPDSAGYDSTAMAWVPVHFDTLRAFRIDQRTGGFSTSAWIDGQGRIVRITGPSGFTMERSAFEIAYENFRRRDTTRVVRASAAVRSGDVVPTTALSAELTLPAPSLAALRVRLLGVTLAGFDLSSDRQRLAGDTLAVRREAGSTLAAGYRLPSRDPTLGEFLQPEPLIQSDHPTIWAQARHILGSERDPARAAELFTHWVHGHLTRQAAGGAPSALQVLARRRGDCNEHTVLYVALARAAGLPARTVAGLLYLRGRFYYHAWPEVYLGSWIAVDPTLDQFPADAAHLRFAVGALALPAELVRLIGKLRLEVL